MKIKANFHLHTAEDPGHAIPYSIYDAVDYAAKKGFDTLALTCHRMCACTDDHVAYAAAQKILLIPSIEADIYDDAARHPRNHVLILNCGKDAEKLRTFDDLRAYKKGNPDIFVIAPHPFHYGTFSLHDLLAKHIDVFDAIEHSWFFSKWFNRNKEAARATKRHRLPFIATSDTHFFDFFDKNYIIIESAENTPESLWRAIRTGSFENIASPRFFPTEMFLKFGMFAVKDYIKMLQKSWRRQY
ncbi:PHP domain-containing protein [bacterium]|nr:PHP domain-containing protein [bacterium]